MRAKQNWLLRDRVDAMDKHFATSELHLSSLWLIVRIQLFVDLLDGLQNPLILQHSFQQLLHTDRAFSQMDVVPKWVQVGLEAV